MNVVIALATLRGVGTSGSAGALTQKQLGRILNISPATIRNWEQRRSQPTGPALVLLQLLTSDGGQDIVRKLRHAVSRP